MNFIYVRLWILTLIFSTLACATHGVQDYKSENPKLNIESYFTGPIQAYGVFTDRSGVVKKRFQVSIQSSWSGDIGTLDEKFVYSDGTTSQRVWTLKRISSQEFIGTAADVVGEAKGELAGNAFHLNYVLALNVDGSIYNVRMDDWMYLIDQHVIINRTRMTKWGVHLGDVTLSFFKP